MTTRRGLLGLAGATALGMGVAACTTREASAPPKPLADGDHLVVELAGGLAVIDTAQGRPVVPAALAVANPDWTTLVQAQDAGGATRVTARRLADGTVVSSGTLRDTLRPRAVSPDGRIVALTTPPQGPTAGTAGTAGTGRIEAGRTRTTVVVADSGGERRRLDLPGNLVPEAFSVAGDRLFVLDYLPPAAPDHYRVRAIDLAAGQVQPLATRAKQLVPPGAEEQMRGEGRQAVYAPLRSMLFTLYTHQPDHLHTRDLLAGARADRPHVHAFVHSLHLSEGWAYCVDLPSPFGEHPAAGHAIAINPSDTRLVVVDTAGGAVADINLSTLAVDSVTRIPPLEPLGEGEGEGEAAAILTPDTAHLLVGAGRQVVMLPVNGGAPVARWTHDTPVRGLALSRDGKALYVGQTGEIVRRELTGLRSVTRTPAPGLLRVHRAVSRR
jgi:hypothetical protein